VKRAFVGILCVWLASCSVAPTAPAGADGSDRSSIPQTPGATAGAEKLVTEDRGPGCLRMLLGRFRIEGDPTAPKGEAIWLMSEAGEQVWPVWPSGFTATFVPELRILDPAGDVVVAEGRWFDAGGGWEGADAVHVCSVDERTLT
jgi:hypothetical protein